MDCLCGSMQPYAACCGQYHEGKPAPTPEALMRSRYTAYAMANIDYIQATMKGAAALGFDPVSAKAWAESVEWTGLEVLTASEDGDTGYVSFKAHFTAQNEANVLSELSEFKRMDGRWYYTREAQPERNSPCPCGSGKKYKKCCG